MSSRICASMIAQLAFGEPNSRDTGHPRNANKPKKSKSRRLRRQPDS
ncbi:MAG: hypothetical protein ABWY45_03490 [Mycobacterium sp.]